MEKHYSGYNNLNWLLSDCFEAERRYYNAAEDVQETGLKRFLHHESVNRNRFATKIAEQLTQAGIEAHKFSTAKGHLHRTGIEEKNALTNQNWKSHLQACQVQDERCLKRYAQLLKEAKLPTHVLQMLQKQRSCILNALDALTLHKKRIQLPAPEQETKVIRLKAM